MSKRTAAIMIALFACPMMGLCRQTLMTTWSVDSREMLTALVVFVSLFYIGLDLVLAPETSLWYRIEKSMPFTWATPGLVRATGLLIILMSLLFGWIFIDQLLRLIK